MAENKNHWNRRDFLKDLGLGVIGYTALARKAPSFPLVQSEPASPQLGGGHLFQKVASPARVSLVKGNDRREIVYQSLKLIEDDILNSIGSKKILIKPNVVTPINPLGSLHADAVRAILDFLTPHYKSQILIGEAATINTMEGYKNYGYLWIS